MKSQQAQIKLKPSNKKKELGFLTAKIKKISRYFLTKRHVSFSKKIIIKTSCLKNENTRKQKQPPFLLNSLIFVFILPIEQILLDVFWVKIKNTLNREQNLQKNHDLFYRSLQSCFSFENKLGHQAN